jgi:preprotein translocase subunit Sss1
MNDLKNNSLGFVLLGLGIGVVLLGHYTRIDKLADSGFALIGMAGFALKASMQSPKAPEIPAP